MQPRTDFYVSTCIVNDRLKNLVLLLFVWCDLVQPASKGFNQMLLAVAAAYGDAEILKLVLRKLVNTDVNKCAGGLYRAAALHRAAEGGHLAAVTCLLGAPHIKVNTLTPYGDTALSLAVQRGHAPVACELLADARTSIGGVNTSNETVLHVAACRGDVAIVNAILRHAEAHTLVNARDAHQRTPLMVSATEGNFEAVNSLLLEGIGVDVNALDVRDRSALVASLYRGQIEVAVRLMLDPRTRYDDVGINIVSDLERANEHHVDVSSVVAFLLDHGFVDARCRSVADQNTPLHFAALFNNVALAKELLAEPRENIDVNARNAEGFTPIFLAQRTSSRADVFDALIQHMGIDVSIPNNDGETLLHDAASAPRTWRGGEGVERFRTLLMHRTVHVNAVNAVRACDGFTPLHVAIHRGMWKYARLLIRDPRVNVNVRDNCGQTPLHACVRRRSPKCLRWLLRRDDAHVNKRNREHNTALTEALKQYGVHFAGDAPTRECIQLLGDGLRYAGRRVPRASAPPREIPVPLITDWTRRRARPSGERERQERPNAAARRSGARALSSGGGSAGH